MNTAALYLITRQNRPLSSAGLIDTNHVYDMLAEFYGEEKLREIIAEYAAAYDMGDTSVEAAARAVFVEIVCDSEAGINYFGMESGTDVEGFMRNVHSATTADMYSRDTRGPPAEDNVHFKREPRKVKTFLRHFTGEVRSAEYLELSNVEKATIKSNVKTGFGDIAPDAKRGIVSAHDRNRGYTYYFACNADYSLTVIDAFDNAADAEIIDGLRKEIAEYDGTGVQHSSKSVVREGNGPSNRGNDSGAYEKTEPGRSTEKMDEGTPEGYRKRDSKSSGDNRADSRADAARDNQEVKFSRELDDGDLPAYEQETQEGLEELREREEAEYAEVKGKLDSGELKSREGLTPKAKNYLQKAERTLLNRIRYALHVPWVAAREYLKGTVEQLSAEFLATGRFTQETVDRLFEDAWNQGVIEDREFCYNFKQ